MTWDKRWKTGIKALDAQHMELFSLLNKMIDEGLFSEHVYDNFNEIIEYTELHFAEEERRMQEAKYPYYPEHLSSHLNLMQEMLNVRAYLKKKGRFKQNPKQFMVRWLINHIQFEDMLYVQHLKKVEGIRPAKSVKFNKTSEQSDSSGPSFYIFDPENISA